MNTCILLNTRYPAANELKEEQSKYMTCISVYQSKIGLLFIVYFNTCRLQDTQSSRRHRYSLFISVQIISKLPQLQLTHFIQLIVAVSFNKRELVRNNDTLLLQKSVSFCTNQHLKRLTYVRQGTFIGENANIGLIIIYTYICDLMSSKRAVE
jgi:hypothetical protein